jgi:carbon starvation protein
MIAKERHVRPIGYGAMLMEGLVGVVALIAAASLDNRLYYDINTDLEDVAKYQAKLRTLYDEVGEARDPLHQAGVRDPDALPVRHYIAEVERLVGGESLRGRTGGAVTLAVGMALIFTDALRWTGLAIESVMKYWYHFAIMFEALFILTTIDTGTRIARFLLQEALGKVHPKFEQTDWLPGAVLSTALVTGGWALLITTGSIATIWPMFGIANQLLAVIALTVVTTWLINSGRGRYAWVTLLPMCWVISTTFTAGTQLLTGQFPRMIASGDDSRVLAGYLNIAFTVFVMSCVVALLLIAVSRWLLPLVRGPAPTGRDDLA